MEEKSIIEQATELVNKGITLKREYKFEEALKCYIEAVKLIPTNGNVYYAMGKLFYLTDRYEEAMNAYYLASKYEANSYLEDLYRHYGHAFVDGNEKLRSTNEFYILAYYYSIDGTQNPNFIITKYILSNKKFVDFVLENHAKLYNGTFIPNIVQLNIAYEKYCYDYGKRELRKRIKNSRG